MEALATVTCIAFILLMVWILWGAYQQQVAGIEANRQVVIFNQQSTKYHEQAARNEVILAKSEEIVAKQIELHERYVTLLSRVETLVAKFEQKLSSSVSDKSPLE